jgi:copper chaperone CopZ
MQTVGIAVQGMTCMGCVASVTRVLHSVAGVNEVQM